CNLQQFSSGKSTRSLAAGAGSAGSDGPLQMVERQAPLRRSRSPVCVRLPELAVRAARLPQHENGEFGIDSLRVGPPRAEVERQDDQSLAARQLCLDGAAFHVSPSANRTEVSRAILRRHGADLLQRLSAGNGLARWGKIPALFSLQIATGDRARPSCRRSQSLSFQRTAGYRLQ